MHAMGHVFGAAVVLAAGFGAVKAEDDAVVRRVSRSAAEEMQQTDEAAPEPVHCVVWGEGAPKGMKFTSKADAEATFKSVQRTETVAAHYKGKGASDAVPLTGLVELKRHLSPRLASISWRQLRSWCAEEHPNAEQPNLLQEDMPPVEEKPKVESVQEQPQGDEQPTFERAESPLKMESESLGNDDDQEHDEHRGHRKRSRFVSHGHDASSLDDQDQPTSDSMEERPSRKRRRRSSRIVERGSVDDDDEHHEHRGHHDNYLDRLVLHGHRAPSFDDEEQPPREERPAFEGMQEQPSRKKKRSVRTAEPAPLEHSFHNHNHGESSLHNHNHGEKSFHNHNLGESSSFLGKAGLAGKVTSLGQDVASLAQDLADLSKRMGTQEGQRPSSILELAILESDTQGSRPMILKDRVAKVEGSLTSVQKEMSSWEQEIFGHSDQLRSSKSTHGLKNRAIALEGNVKTLKGRMAALKKGMDQVAGQVDKLETSMEQLSSKTSALFRNVGNANAAPDEMQRRDQDASFVDRFSALEGYAEKLQASVGSLEVELRGAEARAPPRSQKAKRFSEKLKVMEAHMKSLGGRLTSLEQEV